MARPITWQNIDAPDLRGVSGIFAQGNEALSQGLGKLESLAKGQRQQNVSNFDEITKKNTEDVIAGIQNIGSIEELGKARDTGMFENQALAQNYGENIDTKAVREAQLAQEGILQNRSTTNYNYAESQRAQQEKPLIEQYNSLIQANDYAGAEAFLTTGAGKGIQDKSGLYKSAEVESERDTDREHLLTQRAKEEAAYEKQQLNTRSFEALTAATEQIASQNHQGDVRNAENILTQSEGWNNLDIDQQNKLRAKLGTEFEAIRGMHTKDKPIYEKLKADEAIALQSLDAAYQSNLQAAALEAGVPNFVGNTDVVSVRETLKDMVPEDDADAMAEAQGTYGLISDALKFPPNAAVLSQIISEAEHSGKWHQWKSTDIKKAVNKFLDRHPEANMDAYLTKKAQLDSVHKKNVEAAQNVAINFRANARANSLKRKQTNDADYTSPEVTPYDYGSALTSYQTAGRKAPENSKPTVEEKIKEEVLTKPKSARRQKQRSSRRKESLLSQVAREAKEAYFASIPEDEAKHAKRVEEERLARKEKLLRLQNRK